MEYSEVTPLIGITKASLNDMILLKCCFISLLPPIQISCIANCSKESYVRVLFVVSRVNEWRAIVWLARYFSLALPHCKATDFFNIQTIFIWTLPQKKDTYYTTVQILWLLFHTVRLLLIVEPCHFVAAEVRIGNSISTPMNDVSDYF